MCDTRPDVLPLLSEGYERFRRDGLAQKRSLYQKLAEGQRPKVLVIACADSRVDPAVIFDTHPGEMFTVRNVANLVPPYEEDGTFHGTSAAIEFAVCALEVPTIVVLGHGQCGGILASLARAGVVDKQLENYTFLNSWVGMLDKTRDDILHEHSHKSPAELQKMLEFAAVRQSIHNLQTFPFVQEAVAAGKLTIQGAWFAIAEASLYWLRADGRFALVTPQES